MNTPGFATRLKEWRTGAGLSQDEAKERLGIGSRSYFSQLENGLRQPSRKIVNLLRTEEIKSGHDGEAPSTAGGAMVQEQAGQYQAQEGASDVPRLIRLLVRALTEGQLLDALAAIGGSNLASGTRALAVGALREEIQERSTKEKT